MHSEGPLLHALNVCVRTTSTSTVGCLVPSLWAMSSSYMHMQGLPMDGTDPAVIALYAVVLFAMGACIAAAAPACNNPIFAEIVPPELRNMVRA